MILKNPRLMASALMLAAVVLGAPGARAEAPAPAKKAAASTEPAGAAGTTASGGAAPGAADATPKVKVERGAGGHKVYRITEEIRIEGKIQKPEAFFFYQKSSINYDWQELKQDFIPKILDSVSRAPF
jgi:hypothetical protein